MIEIKIVGRPSVRRDWVEYLLPKYIKQLKLSHDINLIIQICRLPEKYGETYFNKDFRTAVVRVNSKLGVYDFCKTLAHEMVHVKHLVIGKLSYDNKNIYWCGKVVKTKRHIDMPWELAAFAKEEIMFRRACK